MCLFSRDNPFTQGLAYKLGVEKFDCGVCPECLAKKARLWSLRCSAESQYNRGIMVTLTYDDYKYSNGRIVGELPPKKLLCNVRHCQLFLKRLRKHFSGVKIKYLLTAEHGSRTGRAHYHAILFGIDFNDRVPYKNSKRGNLIYKSETLTKLWSHGICTIDAVNITGKVARYCTKYCAKDSRCDDTFMLMSRGIGDKWLLEKFNGKSYILDGVEYPIPKLIWNKYIENVYKNNFIFKKMGITYKYRSFNWYISKIPDEFYNPESVQIAMHCANFQKKRNRIFAKFKRMNAKFKAYLEYWRKKAELYELNKPSDLDRIKALKDDKYFFYKQKAIRAKIQEELFGRCIVPRSGKTSLIKYYTEHSWNVCAVPLVIKAQMTPKTKNKLFKTAFWLKNLQEFVYLRPLKA